MTRVEHIGDCTPAGPCNCGADPEHVLVSERPNPVSGGTVRHYERPDGTFYARRINDQ